MNPEGIPSKVLSENGLFGGWKVGRPRLQWEDCVARGRQHKPEVTGGHNAGAGQDPSCGS